MGSCDCHADVSAESDRKVLTIALVLNGAMFFVDLAGGIVGESTGLIADSLDMLADASAYAIGLLAISRTAAFKTNAAFLSGSLLLALGLGTVAEVVRRAFAGSEPVGPIMLATALLALAVNATVLRLLARHRNGEVHLRATWIFTRADVVANLGVILASGLVAFTGSRFPDLAIGLLIGLWIVREAVEILRTARASWTAMEEAGAAE